MAGNHIRPEDMCKSRLSPVAKRLCCAVSNAIKDRFGAYTKYCDAVRCAPVRPAWMLQSTPPTKQAKDAERSECGKYFGRNARKIPDWPLLEWTAQQVVEPEQLDDVVREWKALWVEATGQAVPAGHDSAQEQRIGKLEHERDVLQGRLAALIEQNSAAVADRDQLADELAQRAATEHHLREELARVRAHAAALDKGRERDRSHFGAAQRSMLDTMSELDASLRAWMEQAGSAQQHTALLLSFLASVDDTVKADMGLTSFGLRSDVTASRSTCLPPALAALLEAPFAEGVGRPARRFAVYVHALLLGDGTRPLDLAHVAARAGVSGPVLVSILKGECLPTFGQLQDLIAFCPAIGVHGQALLTDARAAELAGVLACGAAASPTSVPASHPVRLAARAPQYPSVTTTIGTDGEAARVTSSPLVDTAGGAPGRVQPRLRLPHAVRAAVSFGIEIARTCAGLVLNAGRRGAALLKRHRTRLINVALALTVTAAVAFPVMWLVKFADEHFTPITGIAVAADLAVLAGDIPARRRNASGEYVDTAWAGIVTGTPRSTTFEPADKTSPFQGLRGVLWLEYDPVPGCSPAVALKITTSTGLRTMPLLGDNAIDLTLHTDINPDWNTRFQVELTRLDWSTCPLSVVWSDAGTR